VAGSTCGKCRGYFALFDREDMPDVVQAGRGDLSDWVELMEAVEALCPVRPRAERQMTKRFEFKL